MPQRSVLVTYTLHPTPAPGSLNPIQAALNGIRAQFPLRNLHWKSSSRTALRTIQEVDVTLLELGEAGSFSKEIAGSILDWPLVNLCLVVCEVRTVCMIKSRHKLNKTLRTQSFTELKRALSYVTGYPFSQLDEVYMHLLSCLSIHRHR